MNGRVTFDPFVQLELDERLCQGDIVLSLGNSAVPLGMIVTADCDIAQDKAGEELTLLQIVPAETYIRETWARREAERLYKRQLEIAIPPLNSAIAKRDVTLASLNAELLTDWLESSTPDQILSAVAISGKSRVELHRPLKCIAAWLDKQSASPLEKLKHMWIALETAPKAIRSRLGDILDPARGASDVYFLPYISDLREVGFVIKLRSFEAVHKNEIFSSKTDARISGNANSYHRIARLSDGIKFSVVQRMAILFSRIGLEEKFEDESSLASSLVVECLHAEICGEQK